MGLGEVKGGLHLPRAPELLLATLQVKPAKANAPTMTLAKPGITSLSGGSMVQF